MTLDQVIAGITPADTAAMERAKARWDSIAKPLGSLGALEEAVIRIAGMTGSAEVDISKRAVVVMCADNGVVAQGVTQTGQEVTAIVAENMSTGDTSVCAMARSAGAEVVPVDIGTAVPLTGARIVQRCVRRGTADMTQGPAMSRGEAVQAVLTGVETARELCAGGVHLLATGEMGIGNTTTSSAVAAVLLGQEPVVMTGRGAGLSDAGLQKKIHAIETAVAVNRPDPADVLDVLWLPGTGKKNRPAGLLRVLCRPADTENVARAVLRHTHTLGLRRQLLQRLVLPRRATTCACGGASLPAKEYELEGRMYVRPEADAVARQATALGLGAPALRFGRK